jgi:hypothetical protein
VSEEKEPYEVIKARHYANAFSGASGEFVLQELMKFCGMLGDGFSPVRGETEFNAGKRAVICYIFERLQLNELQVYAKTKIDSEINKVFKESKDFEETQLDDYATATFKE